MNEHTHTHVDENGNVHTHTHRHSHEQTKAVLNRLSRAQGHLDAVRKMVERGEDCSQVLVQLSAVISALNGTASCGEPQAPAADCPNWRDGALTAAPGGTIIEQTAK